MPQAGYTDTFNQFIDKLGKRLDQAKSAGMGHEAITHNAERVGDWLSQSYTPETPEERVLQELWRVSDHSEQQAMASAMVKLVEHSN